MKKKKKKSGFLVNAILVLLFIAGLSLLLYPTFSELWNSTRQSRAIASYSRQVSDMNTEEYDMMWKLAEDYNKSLRDRSTFYTLDEEQRKEYEQLLNVSGNGIMAYVEIPKIDCSLPIYHGAEESVLQIAVGHLEWSSLPVGGESTHCILSGHRGLPSAKLFTDLDKMEIGDQFYITVLDQKLAYEVDQIDVILPEEVDDLGIVEGKDYVTLVTCTPYGINSHRLLVRGHRVEYVEPETEQPENLIEKVMVTENLSEKFWTMVVYVFGGLIALILLMMLLFRKKKKK